MGTRREHGTGSVYQRRDGRWVAAVSVNRRRKQYYCHTQQEAYGIIAEFNRQRVVKKQIDALQRAGSIKFFE